MIENDKRLHQRPRSMDLLGIEGIKYCMG